MTALTSIDRNSAITRVILIRHGQSTYNAEKRHQGSCDDSVLTTTGRIAAYQTGLALRHLNISSCYVSPLQRAQETAQEILAAIATETEQLTTMVAYPTLKELSLPLWEGLPYQVVRAQFAEEYRCWKEHPEQFQMSIPAQNRPPQQDAPALANAATCRYPVLDLYDRAQQFWQEVLPFHAGETLLIVSHSGTIRALLSTALGLPPTRFHSLQQSNCGISILNFPVHFSKARSQPACLEAMNLTAHLGEKLPKLKEGKQGMRLLLVPMEGNSERIQTLAKRLESVEIDLCICHDLDSSHHIANQLLQAHPDTMRISVLHEDFLQSWHESLATRCFPMPMVGVDDSRPFTALVIARDRIALQGLSQLLEIQPQRLHLRADTLSVIHYPQALNVPVLQVLNAA